MKILKSGALCVLLCIACMSTYAQNLPLPVSEPDYNKPKLFADLPDKFKLDLLSFESLLELPEGQTVNVRLTGPFNYHGTVVSTSDPKDVNFRSVVIKAINRQGATLTFTRTKNTDGTYSYIGRILSHKHSDAFQIEQENGQYVLVKKHLYDLFNE
jgi:hypothetical protein